MKKSFKYGRAKVPMNNLVRAALLEARSGALSDYFIEHNGRPIKKPRTAFETAIRNSGLKGVTPHTIRHTAASWALMDDIPMIKISKFLGHRNVKTTEQI